MFTEKTPIQLTLVYKGDTIRMQTYLNEYYSLMTLISDNLAIPGFGLCCGMGSCGTCLVQITDSFGSVNRNVLACGISINDSLANACIRIPDVIY
jgi:aerobic-type carbon monoxide dehydrogenase small subunit (CoxS/CutS family)